MRRPEFIDDIETLPEPVRQHLLRDFGPVAAAAGGELMLTAAPTPQLAQIVAMAARNG